MGALCFATMSTLCDRMAKQIIGVPVLPGFAPIPGHISLDVDDGSSSDVTSGGKCTLGSLISCSQIEIDP
jgi:hypothetical protein